MAEPNGKPAPNIGDAFDVALSTAKQDEGYAEPEGDTQETEGQDEQSSGEVEGAGEKTTKAEDTAKEPKSEAPVTEDKEEQFVEMSAEELKTLSKKNRDTYQRMQRAFTRKCEAVAKERKKLEASGVSDVKWQHFIKAYEQDPQAAARQLAEHNKIKVEPSPQTVVATKGLQDELKEALGPDLEYLAEAIGPILEKRFGKMVETAVAPLNEAQQEVAIANAQAAVDTTLDTFSKKLKAAGLPDWKPYEAKMEELMSKFPGKPGIDPIEYLDGIYSMARKDQIVSDSEAAAAKKLSAKMQRSVDEGDSPRVGSGSDKVTPKLTKTNSFDDAFEQALSFAKQGIAVE